MESGSQAPLAETVTSENDRDLRLDFVRGVALLVIFTDHIPGNPTRQYMPISFGFSDMAEVFLFSSGYLRGLRTARTTNTGFGRAHRKTLIRLAQLYTSILLMHVLAFSVLELASIWSGRCPSPRVLSLPDSPSPVHWSDVITLKRLLFHTCVLVLYLLLTVANIMIVPMIRAAPKCVLAASALTYLAVQVEPEMFRLPVPWNRSVYFNPLAWQFLFIGGLLCGIDSRLRHRIFPSHPASLLVALGILNLAFVLAPDPALPELFWGARKSTLGPLRLVHFGSVVILARAFFPRNSPFLRDRSVRVILNCGRYPLTTYVAGSAFAVAGTVVFSEVGPSAGLTAAVNITGWIGCAASASVAAAVRRDSNRSHW